MNKKQKKLMTVIVIIATIALLMEFAAPFLTVAK
jgi:hypothetical protein